MDQFNDGQETDFNFDETFERIDGNGVMKDFYMGRYEVTQKIWTMVMGSNPSCFRRNGDLRPVERISWYDAIVFCNKASLRSKLQPCYSLNGKKNPASWGPVPVVDDKDWDSIIFDPSANGIRLPTKDEWIYAAKEGNLDSERYFSGSIDVDFVAWYKDNSDDETHEVGKKAPNDLGIYDMSGNVYEWCWDQDPGDKTKRCNMGGSFTSDEDLCHVDSPFFGVAASSYFFVGLRFAMNAPERPF